MNKTRKTTAQLVIERGASKLWGISGTLELMAKNEDLPQTTRDWCEREAKYAKAAARPLYSLARAISQPET